jgi:TfoX/Sxy family transcriptional regulator of competence genes
MGPSTIIPKARFESLAEEFRGNPKVSLPDTESQSKRRFGSSGLRVDNRIFAMLSKERLVVKLCQQRVDFLVDSGEGDRYDPGHGRLMKEWLSVKPTSRLEWLALAREAMKFVAGDSRQNNRRVPDAK